MAVVMNRICIPIFGIAGAALSSMSYQIMQCIWMNLYLKKMGYWPYQRNLCVQGVWILLLVGVNYVINFVYFPSLLAKSIFYVVVLMGLLLTFWMQGLIGKKESWKKK
jgi:O-antigen/teichoic acid export membrane protein